MWLSSDSSSFVNCRALAPRECESLRRPHFSFEGRKRIEKFLRRSGVVRTTRERLPSAIFLRPFAPVAQVSARRASNAEVAGEIPAGNANHAALAQPAEAPRSDRGG